jgi:hypothetical protein
MIISSTYGRGNKYFQRTRRPQRVIDRTGLLPTLGDAGYSFPGRELVPAASAVDEAVVARFVPRSGCNAAGGPSDKPGYEAMVYRDVSEAFVPAPLPYSTKVVPRVQTSGYSCPLPPERLISSRLISNRQTRTRSPTALRRPPAPSQLHSGDRRLLSTKYTKSTDWWRNQNKDMTGFKVNSW